MAKICPECGREYSNQRSYCEDCGEKLKNKNNGNGEESKFIDLLLTAISALTISIMFSSYINWGFVRCTVKGGNLSSNGPMISLVINFILALVILVLTAITILKRRSRNTKN